MWYVYNSNKPFKTAVLFVFILSLFVFGGKIEYRSVSFDPVVDHHQGMYLFTFTPHTIHAQRPEAGTAFIRNPIRAETITELLLAILRIFMVIAVPIIIFFIVYSGFLYVTARGNSEQIQTATRAFTYAIIGGLIILGAMVLVAIIQNLVAAFGVDTNP